jgi:hypothetical protein
MMANKDNLIKLVAQKLGPDKLKQMVDQVEQTVGADPDVNAQSIDAIIKQFEFVAEHPDQYKTVLAQAIQSGVIDADTLPPEFDPVTIAVMLLAFYGLRERLSQRGQPQMARGGLSKAAQQLQSQGRGGDTILAHINPMEAEALRRMGGSGTVNPNTGLREFKGGIIGKVVKTVAKVAPIAAAFIPGLQPFAPLIGAVSGGITGGLKGAVLGGITGALSTPTGQGLAKTIGTGMTTAVPSLGGLLSPEVLGAGVLGGATSAIAGKNPITGALTSGLTSFAAPQVAEGLNSMAPNAAGVTADMVKGANIAAQSGVNPLIGAGTAGVMSIGGNLINDGTLFGTPQTVAGVPAQTSGPGVQLAPVSGDPPFASSNPYALPTSQFGGSQGIQLPTNVGGFGGNAYALPTSMPSGSPEIQLPSSAGAAIIPPTSTIANAASVAPTAGPLSQVSAANIPNVVPASSGFKMSDIAMIGGLGMLLGGKTPQQAMDAIQQDPALTAQQKEGMLRALTNYKFDTNATTFPSAGTPEWDKFLDDMRYGREIKNVNPTLTEIPAKAKGGRTKRQSQGALSQVSRLSLGAGDGRSDSIDARLSDGEYVIDAETVALLGNGSTKAGAAMLDQMRQGIRKQKGRALAKGNFSPDAKSPLAYMKGGLK